MKKYKKYKKNDTFYIDLLFSYNNICSIYNIVFPYGAQIENIVKNVDTIPISDEQKVFCKEMYALFCLSQQK